MKKVTAKKIAEELGISTATVDRVLNNRKGVSRKTVIRVQKKAEELGYRRNRAAKYMSTQKNHRIAFVLPVFPNYFWDELAKEIRKAASLYEEFGIFIEIQRVHTFPDNEQVQHMHHLIEQGNLDAIVIAPHDAKPFEDVINKADDLNIPVFTVNTDVPNSKRVAYVGSDYFDAGYIAAELVTLFKENIKKVSVLRDSEDTYQMQNKQRGFLRYFQENELNMEINTITFNNSAYITQSRIEKMMKKYANELEDSDAVYVASGILGEIEKYWNNNSKKQVVIGHDLNEKIYNAMNHGIVTATICQDPMAQATITLQKVTDYLLENKIEETTNHIVKLEIVTKANSKYYL